MQAVGCVSTPEQRYRVLSFFFDGVPPPAGAEIALIPEQPGLPGELEVARARPVKARYTLHEPYSDKSCDQCHSSRYSNRLVAPAEELCWSCHDPEDFPGEVVHGPVSAGACAQCHDPHRSIHDSLLVESESDLCASCHDQSTFAQIEKHREEEGDHCIRCHDPHAADREYMLREEEGGS
jgi:predicted CXXCH cytochrome family protein